MLCDGYLFSCFYNLCYEYIKLRNGFEIYWRLLGHSSCKSQDDQTGNFHQRWKFPSTNEDFSLFTRTGHFHKMQSISKYLSEIPLWSFDGSQSYFPEPRGLSCSPFTVHQKHPKKPKVKNNIHERVCPLQMFAGPAVRCLEGFSPSHGFPSSVFLFFSLDSPIQMSRLQITSLPLDL